MNNKERRKSTVINLKQQAFFSAMLVSYAVLAIIVFSMLSNPMYSEHIRYGFNYPSVLGEMIAYGWDHWVAVLTTLVFMTCCALLFSHQIFGPMRRFENALLQKMNNPAEPVHCHVRRADYFKRFAKLLEEVLNLRP